MNLVQSEIHARLRHGLTLTELAEDLGLAIPTLCNVLRGHQEAGPKTLKALGIVKHIVYTLEPNSSIPEGIQARAPRIRAKRPEQSARIAARRAARALVEQPVALVPAVMAARLTLTTERVMVAVRHKLNPGKSWGECVAQMLNAGDMDERTLDEHWLSYCQTHGTIASSEPEALEPYAKPGELYSHLKPINRGPDHRRPLAYGEKPTIQTVNVPEVTG